MRTLSYDELSQISGGFQSSIDEALAATGFFAAVSGIIGGTLGAVFYYETLPSAFMQSVLLQTMNVNLVTLPIAIFAGFGGGIVIGSAIGFVFHQSGMISRLE